MPEALNKNNFVDQIASLIRKSQEKIISSVNHTIVITYFEIGRMIVEEEQNGNERAEYGKQILLKLSEKLIEEFGKGFSVTNLKQMKSFYLIFQKGQTPSDQFKYPNYNFKLSWSHYLKLMRIEDEKERNFYEIEAYNNNWSLREFQRQYDTALYTRLSLSRNSKEITELSTKGQILEKATDSIKDPYILEFLDLPELNNYSENDLEEKLIDKLEHQDIGQMQMYVNYFDREIKLPEEDKTIGLILCQDKNETLIKYTLPENNEQIFASKYLTVLPSKESLKQLIEKNLEN